MLIAGAGGHAVEVLCVLQEANSEIEVYFFDDYNLNENLVLKKYPVFHTSEAVIAHFSHELTFVLGTGAPQSRHLLYQKLENLGGILQSVISNTAFIGKEEVNIEVGVNIMPYAVITQRVKIGKGTLVHLHSSVHHDSEVGVFCELSPGCRILGNVKIGNFVSIGTNAVVLPGIKIESHAVVGAGAVVTKNVAAGQTVVGVPAKTIIKN